MVKRTIEEKYSSRRCHKFKIPEAWKEFFDDEKIQYILKDVWYNLIKVKYVPDSVRVFACLERIHPETVKVVILGQDPYEREEDATGLAFSIPASRHITASLRNVYTELRRCYNSEPDNGSLKFWREQGVILLNSAMTVTPNGKKHYGIWRAFIMTLLCYINNIKGGTVFMFWGLEAKSFMLENSIQERSDNLYLYAAHPVNRQNSFYGNNNFVEANAFLKKPIVWHNEKAYEKVKEADNIKNEVYTLDECMCLCLFKFYDTCENTFPGQGEGEELCRMHKQENYTGLISIENWRQMLCNSYPCEIEIEGTTFLSVTHVIQRGHTKKVKPDIMEQALTFKFKQPQFEEILLQTKSAKLQCVNEEELTKIIEEIRIEVIRRDRINN
jgi:uracil-DNA glycosylase